MKTIILITLILIQGLGAACRSGVEMGNNSVTALQDVSISSASADSKLKHAVNSDSVKLYIEELIANGSLLVPSPLGPSPVGYTSRNCDGSPTDYKTMQDQNGVNWLDRNLGATQVATSSTDTAAYGDLYQWGRKADGHQCRDSSVTSTLAIDSASAGNNFITSSSDWLATQDDTLWKADATGANEVCPAGYHVPTEAEWKALGINDSADAYTKLKMTLAGYRMSSNASLGGVSAEAEYWSSTTDDSKIISYFIGTGGAIISYTKRADGASIRCRSN